MTIAVTGGSTNNNSQSGTPKNINDNNNYYLFSQKNNNSNNAANSNGQNGVGAFGKRDSVNSQGSHNRSNSHIPNEKSLTQKLNERMIVLQQHLDNLASSTANYEPYFE